MKRYKKLFKEDGEKIWYRQDNVGRRGNYIINFYDGVRTHKDGSPFYDIRIFRNKKDMYNFISELTKQGYRERRVGE